jgi:spermidine/putrescine transport system permease protein
MASASQNNSRTLSVRARTAFYYSEAAKAYPLLAPVMLTVGIMLIIALLMNLAHTFWIQDFMAIHRTFTLDNYREALTNPLYKHLFIRSILISMSVTALALLFAYPIAYFVAFKVRKSKMTWIMVLTIPFWTSYLLRVFAWRNILGYNGAINSGLMALGLIDKPLEFLLYNPFAIVITLVHAWMPFTVLPLFVSLEKIDMSLVEAATDLGDGPVARFVRVILPLSLPGVLASSLVIFIPTVGDFVTPNLVGGPDGMMIGNAIALQFGRGNNWPLGSTLSVCSMIIVALGCLIYLWLSNTLSKKVA